MSLFQRRRLAFKIVSRALVVCALVGALPIMAKPSRFLVYVGTYTGPKSRGIYTFPFDAGQGRAGAPSLAAEASSPSFLASHPNGRFLYAVNESASVEGGKGGAVSAYAIERPAGKLRFLNRVSSGGGGPCHIAVAPSGRWAFVANYGGGSVACLPVNEDGTLGEAASFHQHSGSSVNAARQGAPHAHGVTLDPSGRILFVPDLGLDKILAYRLDAATGRLTPHEPAFAVSKAGAGPRHLVFAPNGKFAYVINELDSTVTAFAYDASQGALRELQTLSTLPEQFTGRNTTAEIQVHPGGRLLFGSNRGCDSIAVFDIGRSGRLKPVANVSAQGRTPRNLAVDPTGEWLWVANQDSGSLVLFRVDTRAGQLIPTGESLEIGAPVCVQYVAE